MKKLIRLAFAAAVAVTCLFGATSVEAKASTTDPYIGISPYRHTMTVKPGETYTGSFRTVNVGDVEFDYTVSAAPYQIIDENYTPSFDNVTEKNQVKNWVTFSSNGGHLDPHSSSDPILFTVKVPEDAPSGTQYAAIKSTVVNNSSTSGTAITNITSAAMILYLQVDGGNANYGGEIIENNVPTFVFNPPVVTTSLVSNTGDVYSDATYTLEVFSIFNGETVYSNADKENFAIVLPEMRRFHAQSWDDAPMVGIFKVKQTIKFLDQVSVVEKIVIICPLWLIFLVIFGLFVIIIWLRAKAKSRREEKR